jgi:hypothetical protein
MTEENLQELLADAAPTFRKPPEPPLEAMWENVEERVFAGQGGNRFRFRPSWTVFVSGLAAALVAGVGLGRLTTTRSAPMAATVTAAAVNATASTSRPVNAAYERAASDFLGRTAVLLSSLPTDAKNGRSDARFSAQAGELLVTTRLLLDSPAASDRRFRELLDDLELVLVQVARLREERSPQEIELITDALEERDVVPRIRTAVAQLAGGAD